MDWAKFILQKSVAKIFADRKMKVNSVQYQIINYYQTQRFSIKLESFHAFLFFDVMRFTFYGTN